MKKLSFLFLLICLSFGIAVSAQTRRPLKVDDLFAIQDVSDPQLSPDGKYVAYVVEKYNQKDDQYQRDIYMVPFTGGQSIQLTSSLKNDNHPRWSPDNKYLAFLSRRDKKTQVFLLNRNGGEAIQLTDVKQGVDDFSWSPDGKKLALVITDQDPDEKDDEGKNDKKADAPIVIDRLQFVWDTIGFLKDLYSHIYVFDVQNRTMKQITSGPFDDGGPVYYYSGTAPEWSPDGKWLLFSTDRSSDPDKNRNLDVFVVSADGGEPKKLTSNLAMDADPHWNPDGKSIVYLANTKPDLIWYEMVKVAVIPVAGGQPKLLTVDLDRNCTDPRFSFDGKSIYCLLEDHGSQTLASIPLAGGAINRNVVGEKVVSRFEVGTNGNLVFLASRPNLPSEVFAYASGKSTQITNSNASLLQQLDLATTEKIQFKSKDGTPVEAFVVKPPQFNPSTKYPLILFIHGGPTSQYTDEFGFTSQLYAANGYVVVEPNPRGSTGYGEAFCKAIWADWGNKDYDDVMAAVDSVIEKGYIDPNRLGVAGWSYGGILTDHVITKTDRFKAAASGASELNYLMDYGVDHYQYEWEKEIGLPWEHPEAYIQISPFFKLNKVKTPTLIMCGQQDFNVPLVNSEQFYQGLKRLGVDSMLIVYPEQSHGFRRPSYQKDRYLRWLAWFDHYLQGKPNKVPERTGPAEQQTAK